MDDKKLYTLEERLEMAARSQASSPEAAASLVQHLYKVHTGVIVSWSFDKMRTLIGEFMKIIEEKLLYYGGFCHSLRLAMENDNFLFYQSPSEALYAQEQDFFRRPVWGFRMNNAIVLLGLVLFDHAKGGMNKKDVYHCMRMTLKQYLDALADISFRKDGTQDIRRVERLRLYGDALLKDYDGSKSMKETLEAVLSRYCRARRAPDRLAVLMYFERKDAKPEFLADEMFLAETDCSPRSMKEINTAVADLYLLFVEPYLEMGEYHYERHLQDGTDLMQNGPS